MPATYEGVIGVEIHAELQTMSKMFCSCPVVDSTVAAPNSAVCAVCAGMPGMLPVANQRAVEYGLRVALALNCQVSQTSIFARKNYFYPDLPKGYQISQYEEPLARNGWLTIETPEGEKKIRIRRVHLEEDTGKLTHVQDESSSYSLIDLNRAGVPLLEIVTEPDMHSAEEVRIYAMALRSLLRYLLVNSGDMQKGVLRIEPNISVRPKGTQILGTRTEIKNLNSFRALERAVAYEIDRQTEVLSQGRKVVQETRGWDEARGITVTQRTKEEAEDYRYFPEPDLPPLVVETEWIEQIKSSLPELPIARQHRFQQEYALNAYDSAVLVAEKPVSDYFEKVVQAVDPTAILPKIIANWISGDLFALLNASEVTIENCVISPEALAALLTMLSKGEINQTTAKVVLNEMFTTGKSAETIVLDRGLNQVSDETQIDALVKQILAENPEQVSIYLSGKESIARWFFGQVMRKTGGKANPNVVQQILDVQLAALKE